LFQDVSASRSQRFSYPDLAGALRDAGEHDVHDHDAADHQEDRYDSHHRPGQRTGEIVPELHDGVGPEDAEVVRFIRRKMPARAHDGPRLVHGLLHPLRPARLDVDIESVRMRAVHLEPGHDRDVNEVVLRLSHDGSDGLCDPDHGEHFAVDIDLFAEGVDVGEQLLGNIHANHCGRAAMVVISIRNVAACLGCLDIHVTHVCRHAPDADVFRGFAAEFHPAVHATLQPNVFRQLHAVAERLVVLQRELAVRAQCFDVRLAIVDDPEPVYEENVRAEIRDSFGDVLVGSIDKGDDKNECGDRKNNAEQHQERTQLMRPHGFDRDGCRFAKTRPAHISSVFYYG
jgi:hypothetical protein